MNDPKDWLDDDRDVIRRDADDKATWRGDATVHDEVAKLVQQRRAEHEVVSSLQQLRKLLGRTQVEVANEWVARNPRCRDSKPTRCGPSSARSWHTSKPWAAG